MNPASGLAQAPATQGVLALRLRAATREALEAYAFLTPAMLILLVFIVVPAFYVLWISLLRWDLIAPSGNFIGFGNYSRLLQDRLWWQSLGQTLYFVLGSVPTGMALALGLALLLNSRLPGRGILRGAIFAPFVTPAVATIVIWEWILNTDYGLVNAILAAFHGPKIGWLIDANWIMPAVILYTLWATTGFNMVIFLAGLANIPADLQDAARADGAGEWQVFWNVTWPLLTPTTYFVLLISSISSFKVFNVVFVLTDGTGGPNRAAQTVGLYLYQQAFTFFHAGYASAISVTLFVIILALTLAQVRIGSRKVFYR